MSAFVVETSFRASSDQVTASLKRQAKAAGTMGAKMRGAFKSASKQASIFRANLGANLMSRAITSATAMMSRGVRTVVEEFVSFDDAITQAAAKMPEKIKRGTEAFKQLESAARETGKSTKFSATESAEALNFLAMAGFNADQSMAALPAVTQLATASNMDLARATDISTDALGAFNLMTKDAGQLTTNLTRVNDVFAATVTSANVDMEMLFESMKDGGPVMTSAGQSLETFAALTGKMGSSGIKGSKAGMTLKNMMLQLSGPTAGAKKAIQKLGIEISDQDGNMRDVIEILGDYNEATKDMGSTQRDATTDLIFGRRAIAGVNVLLSEGEEELKAYRDQLLQSGGAAEEMASDIEKSLGNKLLALKSAAIELGFKLIEAFTGEGQDGLDNLIEAVRNFDMKPIISGVRQVIDGMKWLFRTIRDNWNTIKIMIAGFVAFKVALAGINFARAIKGFTNLGSAAGGVGVGGAPGAGKGGGGAAPAGKLGGAIGGLTGAIAALTAGLAVGGLIEDNLLDPARKAGEAQENLANKIISQYDPSGVGRFAKDIDDMSFDELGAAVKQVRMTLEAESSVMPNSLEEFVQGAGEGFANMGIEVSSFFGFISDAQKEALKVEAAGPITARHERQQQLMDIYKTLGDEMMRQANEAKQIDIDSADIDQLKLAADLAADAIDAKLASGVKKETEEIQLMLEQYRLLKQAVADATTELATLAAQAAKTDVNLAVDVTAPEGTNVDTKATGGSAPKVNQSKAGKT